MPQVTGFSASEVPTMLQDLERTWTDARANQNARYTQDTEILRAIFNEQTADLSGQLAENDGCKPVKVVWLENGDHTVEERNNVAANVKTSVTCTLDGPTIASNVQEYFMDDFLKVTLKVRDKDCGNHFTRDEKFRHQMLSKQIDLVNALSQKGALFVAASAGQSLTPGYLGTYQDAETAPGRSLVRVAPGNFNAFDFAPFVEELAEYNRFNNPFVIDGGNLRYAQFNAARQDGTPAGDAGQQNHFDYLRAYRDGRNMTKAGLADRTFIVEHGALALFTGAYFPAVEQDVEGNGFRHTTYRTPILGMNQAGGRPMEADTTYSLQKLPIADGSEYCELFHVWEMRLWYLPLINPLLSANDGVTGVVAVKKDATLTQKGTAMQKAL